MKVALDTSVLIAALLPKHTDHARAFLWVDAAVRGEVDAVICTHALAELYSVLTRLRLERLLSPAEAREMVQHVATKLDVVDVHLDLLMRAIERCAERHAGSGAIFDAMHVLAAEDAGAEVLLTLDRGDPARLARRGLRVAAPPDPPSLLLLPQDTPTVA